MTMYEIMHIHMIMTTMINEIDKIAQYMDDTQRKELSSFKFSDKVTSNCSRQPSILNFQHKGSVKDELTKYNSTADIIVMLIAVKNTEHQ